jgi:hypothetical protein
MMGLESGAQRDEEQGLLESKTPHSVLAYTSSSAEITSTSTSRIGISSYLFENRDCHASGCDHKHLKHNEIGMNTISRDSNVATDSSPEGEDRVELFCYMCSLRSLLHSELDLHQAAQRGISSRVTELLLSGTVSFLILIFSSSPTQNLRTQTCATKRIALLCIGRQS